MIRLRSRAAVLVASVSASVVVAAGPAAAHPGHSSGDVGSDVRHLVFGVDHILVAVALAVAVAVLVALGVLSKLASMGRSPVPMPSVLATGAARTGFGVGAVAAAGAGIFVLS